VAKEVSLLKLFEKNLKFLADPNFCVNEVPSIHLRFFARFEHLGFI
jgi:hypothetical protein